MLNLSRPFIVFQPLIHAIGDAKYVLLGEASHGTSEFYTLRAELTKRLIKEKGFSVIAVEGDWPSCQSINRYIKNIGSPNSVNQVLENFNRWPTWMWANEEISELVEWLNNFNQQSKRKNKVGFYGLDVYSLWESMDEIIKYLERTGNSGLKQARNAFSCFEPFKENMSPMLYLLDTYLKTVLKKLLRFSIRYKKTSGNMMMMKKAA